MKPQFRRWPLLLIVVALTVGSQVHNSGKRATAEGAVIRFSAHSESSSKTVTWPSGILGFMLSERGRQLLRASSSPTAKGLLKWIGEDVKGTADKTPLTQVPHVAVSQAGASSNTLDATASMPCGTASGTRFNLESRLNPVPQNSTAVDFLPGLGLAGADLVVGGANDFRDFTPSPGSSGEFHGLFGLTNETGYYVHRNGADPNPCAPDFEGGLPTLTDPKTGNMLVGAGDPTVAADPATGAFFIADTRVVIDESGESAIGLFRNTAKNLTDSSICPDGTHDPTASAQCWSTSALVNAESNNALVFKPHLAVDERPAGSAPGAGDVYVSGTQTVQSQSVFIAACQNDLSACSPGVKISGSDRADLSHVAVRPDGGVTVTYVVQAGGEAETPETADIKYVTCTPHGAPNPLSCSAPTLIRRETQAIPFNPSVASTGLEAAQFVLHTYPKHAHRQDVNGIETYVIWERCKVPTAVKYPGLTFVTKCSDADIMMAASNDNGKTWRFTDVDTGPQDQFQPWIKTDASTNIVNIVYYSSQADAFQHRSQVLLRQILPGPSTPDPVSDPHIITTMPMDPNTDPFLQGIYIGDYIGVAVRGTGSGSRAYIHYMHTAVPGRYNGAQDPEQNNHLSRFDY